MWQVLYKELFVTRDGRYEVLYILQGPTYPAQYYVGPGISNSNKQEPIVPRFNATGFYYRTEDESIAAFMEMKADLT